ncbi:hypothetical protein [Mucilaginibacter sp. R-33]|uniref:hypothetical protein n=1 Tax=Mucilaginibacter sp. R-33 TaxID=3416711 RepID=UPI003CF73D55
MKRLNLKPVVLYSSMCVYVISLTQHCYCTTESCGDSIMALIMGPLGLIFGGAGFSWLANPFLIIAWFSFKDRYLRTIVVSSISVAFMVSLLVFKEIISDEAGNYSAIVNYKLGYWLWVLSGGIMLVGSMLVFFRSKLSVNITSTKT